ncbi:major facilitator superfamily domain-containing protein [Coniella lustricola]|uniref:Major facilitator superfamily domain-containing protein n=1 Tax=Coniella lustricola TaxID=2025994 RepID=A0A2T2ZUX4_9PEZI|nr:major facilitator superfamily domain-containing protein [Coniella lustricola]
MDASFLRQLVTVESAPAALAPLPLRPQRSITKTYPAVPQRDSTEIELAAISRPATHTGLGHGGPATPDLESSRPASPLMGRAPSSSNHHHDDDGVEALQNIWDPHMNRFRLLSACTMNFANGMSDAAAGPLLPYMEKYYTIGYAVVSLIFVGQAIGFIAGAGLIDPLRDRLGRGRALLLSQLCMAAGYALIASAAPFPAIVVAFFLLGLGISINLALGNIFCGSLAASTTALGAMHGSYGIGGIVGPLLANAFVSVFGLVWSTYYLVTLGLAVGNAVLGLWAYWRFEAEHLLDDDDDVLTAADNLTATTTAAAAAATATAIPPSQPHHHYHHHTATMLTSKLSTLLSTLSSRVVLLGALFIFAYQGAEVSISGWVISFLQDTRASSTTNTNTNIGYVTSGFWGGITLGRFLLALPAHRLGERPFVYAVVLGATVFELLVWFVPNVVGDAVAVAIVGLLLGPVYPCAASIFMRTMSREDKLRGMGVISAFGSSGGAAAPFTTGLLAQVVGTWVLHPIAIALFGAMCLSWWALPRERKRRE